MPNELTIQTTPHPDGLRRLTDHLTPGDPNPQLTIQVMDAPGPGGAHHLYRITPPPEEDPKEGWFIQFQKGPLREEGINGLTHEALLAIVIDRLRCFQQGPFPSEYNGTALFFCERALTWLKRRTADRIARGVEGQSKA